MESAPIVKSENLTFKKEINILSDKNEEAKIIFESEGNSSISIKAICNKKIGNNQFSTSISLDKFKENRYFNQFDDLNEICQELTERIKPENLKLVHNDNFLTLSMQLPSTKFKEISFTLKEKEKSDKEKITELYSIIENYHKENEMLKKDIEEIKIFINEMKKEKEDEKKKQIEAQKYSLINFKSLIVKDVKKINVLKNWIDSSEKKLETELLYRLSRDGESITTFHQLCDNKGPTITLFEKADGIIIGFYSPLSFDTTFKNFKEDMNTFIFNLNNQTKFEKKRKDGSIYCSDTFGPYVSYLGMWGGGVKNMKQCYYNPKSTEDNFKNGENIIQNNKETIIFDLKEVEIWKVKL